MKKQKTERTSTDNKIISLKKEHDLQRQFTEVSEMIYEARTAAYTKVNSVLVELYWNLGKYISIKVSSSEWGEGIVDKLVEYISNKIPDARGFNRRGFYRMKQFYETYAGIEFVSPLVTQIQWSNHLVILSRTKTINEKMFYLQECCKNNYTKRELDRQISTCLYERTLTTQPNLTNALQDLHPHAKPIFRDSYTLDFLGLAPVHFESDLQKGIMHSLKQFIIEFGRDFAFVGEEFRLQVGMKDYFIDLLFYHRELQCLVAFELKVEEFKPEYIGKLSFYLEALDRDVRKPHEKPSIGIILCKGKDSEVVEYALARTTSPAVIAEYTTKLPDKQLLQSKLHEFFDTSLREMYAEYGCTANG